MKIHLQMKSTQRGSEDGIHVNTYEEKKKYHMDSSLAQVFIDKNWATVIKKTESEEKEIPVSKEDLEKKLLEKKMPELQSIGKTYDVTDNNKEELVTKIVKAIYAKAEENKDQGEAPEKKSFWKSIKENIGMK